MHFQDTSLQKNFFKFTFSLILLFSLSNRLKNFMMCILFPFDFLSIKQNRSMTYSEVEGDQFVISQDAEIEETEAEISESPDSSSTHYIILDVQKTQAVEMTIRNRVNGVMNAY